jgi:hypothetical protein
VKHAGPIGLGVRADADRVDVTLLSGSGRPLGHGSMQMATLEAGSYLLSLSAPADAPPVRARPAVVGLVPPDTGPPEDVIRQYVQAPEEEPGTSFTARPAEAQPTPDMEGVEPEVQEGVEGESVPPDVPTEEEPEPPETEGAAEGGL